MDAATKLARLEADLRNLDSLLVCFSGGIDSALVLAVGQRVLGDRCIAMTAVSPALPEREKADAAALAAELGARRPRRRGRRRKGGRQ